MLYHSMYYQVILFQLHVNIPFFLPIAVDIFWLEKPHKNYMLYDDHLCHQLLIYNEQDIFSPQIMVIVDAKNLVMLNVAIVLNYHSNVFDHVQAQDVLVLL